MKNTLYYLLFLAVSYLAFGWQGVWWSMILGVILYWGMSEVAKRNWKEIKERIISQQR